jgi:hypothetical protein
MHGVLDGVVASGRKFFNDPPVPRGQIRITPCALHVTSFMPRHLDGALAGEDLGLQWQR